ncbi:MAG TPA: C45 family peptidase [Chthonomonadaceae bacterium]|nr:C45 family peptidase [Chthonomonadaceae bacterium]
MSLEFSEKVIAGGSQDFATVRHLVLKGSNVEIGRKLGEIARQRHKTVPEPSRDPIITRCRRHYFQQNYAAHYERARGVAEAFGLPFPNESQDVMTLPYNGVVSPGCSVVFYPPQVMENGHGMLSRNYDFPTRTFSEMIGLPPRPGEPAMTTDPYLMAVTPDRGYPSLYMCAYDLLGGCIDGVNSEGLTVAILADNETMSAYPMEPSMDLAVGLNEIEMLRLLLDTCACVEDAKQALLMNKQYYSFLLCHYIIGDRHGQSFVWEYSHAHNREYITEGGGKPQILTNHPLYKYKALSDLPHEDDVKASSYTRYRTLTRALQKQEKFSKEFIKAANCTVAVTNQTLPEQEGKPNRTLWHALYDLHDKSVEIDFYLGEDPKSPRGDRRSGYLSFRLQ